MSLLSFLFGKKKTHVLFPEINHVTIDIKKYESKVHVVAGHPTTIRFTNWPKSKRKPRLTKITLVVQLLNAKANVVFPEVKWPQGVPPTFGEGENYLTFESYGQGVILGQLTVKGLQSEMPGVCPFGFS